MQVKKSVGEIFFQKELKFAARLLGTLEYTSWQINNYIIFAILSDAETTNHRIDVTKTFQCNFLIGKIFHWSEKVEWYLWERILLGLDPNLWFQD